MKMGATLQDIALTVHAHATQSETIAFAAVALSLTTGVFALAGVLPISLT